MLVTASAAQRSAVRSLIARSVSVIVYSEYGTFTLTAVLPSFILRLTLSSSLSLDCRTLT